MASLRDLAQRALRDVEHQLEQDVERVEQRCQAFQPVSPDKQVVEHRSPQKTARSGACSTVPAPIAWNAGTLAEIADQMERMPCPSRVDPHSWRQAVVDCRRLIEDGWAHKALNLGWAALDMFGAVTDPAGDPDADGLAVKLEGRRVLALCASFATVQDGENGRAYLYRRGSEGARLLWEVGRGNTLIGRSLTDGTKKAHRM